MNIMLTTHIPVRVSRTTTIPWSPSPPRAASSSTTRRSRNAWAGPPWLPSLAPWCGNSALGWDPRGGGNVAFSCLKRVAEFYGLWFNKLVNGVYKPTYNWNSMVYGRYNELVNGVYTPTYNWEAPSCIEMEIFIAGNIN